MNAIKFATDPEWEERFNEYLGCNHRALDSLHGLIATEIPEEWLLGVLHDYADSRLRQSQQARQRTAATASLKRVAVVVKALEKSENALEDFETNGNPPDWVRNHHYRMRQISLKKGRRGKERFASNHGRGDHSGNRSTPMAGSRKLN